MTGIVQTRWTGRPENQYARFAIRPKEAFHEYLLTEIRLHFLRYPFRRVGRASETEPDGCVTIDGEDCWVEADAGTMDRKQMQAKWRRYEGSTGDILVVTVSEGRMQRLRAEAETVRDRALFTTLKRLREGKPWVDYEGNTVNL